MLIDTDERLRFSFFLCTTSALFRMSYHSLMRWNLAFYSSRLFHSDHASFSHLWPPSRPVYASPAIHFHEDEDEDELELAAPSPHCCCDYIMSGWYFLASLR